MLFLLFFDCTNVTLYIYIYRKGISLLLFVVHAYCTGTKYVTCYRRLLTTKTECMNVIYITLILYITIFVLRICIFKCIHIK